MAGPAMKRRDYKKRTYAMMKRGPQKAPASYKFNNNVFIKRTIVIGTANTTVAAGWTSFPYTFTASSIPTWANLASNFDSYRINAIKMTFTPFWDGNDTQNQFGANTIALPRVYTLIDRNGITAGSLAFEDQFIESAKAVQQTKPQEAFSIYLRRPGVEGSVDIGGGFANNAKTNWSPWLDTSNPLVVHNGAALGMIIPGGAAAAGWSYHVTCTFYLQFRNAI